MRNDPFGAGNGRQVRRRGGGLFGNIRWLVLLGFLVYGGCYYLSNRTEDPYTGETVLIDSSIGPEQERALGRRGGRQVEPDLGRRLGPRERGEPLRERLVAGLAQA